MNNIKDHPNWPEMKRLIEDIEHGLSSIASYKPFLSLNEIHKKSLQLHRLLKAQ